MIDVAVLRFISSHRLDQIQHGTVFSQLPIRDGNLGRPIVLPLRQLTAFRSALNGLNNLGVCTACLLLDVPNEAVAEGGTNQVCGEECQTETELTTNDSSTEKCRRVSHTDKCEETSKTNKQGE